MVRPLISIIVPVYGIEKFICDCIESVHKQSYDNFECIIVDDCSPDRSIANVSRLISMWKEDNRFRIVRRDKNGGLSAARNTGIECAKGDYIFFLDGDDKLMEGALMSMVSTLNRYPTVEMVQGNVVYENQREVWQFSASDFPDYTNDVNWIRRNMLEWKIAISAWNKLYRSDYIKNNNLSFQEGIIHEDVKWCWDNQKVLKSIAFNSYIGYWYRTDNQTSIMHDVDKTRSSLSFLEIFDLIKGNVENRDEVRFIKDYILPVKVSLYRWSLSKNKGGIKKKLKSILLKRQNWALRFRCTTLLMMLYILPFRYVKRYFM